MQSLRNSVSKSIFKAVTNRSVCSGKHISGRNVCPSKPISASFACLVKSICGSNVRSSKPVSVSEVRPINLFVAVMFVQGNLLVQVLLVQVKKCASNVGPSKPVSNVNESKPRYGIILCSGAPVSVSHFRLRKSISSSNGCSSNAISANNVCLSKTVSTTS